MIIVGVADIHGDGTALDRVLSSESVIDAVLLLGDITNFGTTEDAEAIVKIARSHADKVFGIDGNCDPPEVGDWLTVSQISLRGRAVNLGAIYFLGIPRSLPCPGTTPNETDEEGFESMCTQARELVPAAQPFALVTHQPPLNTVCDRSFLGHVGSAAISRFIEEEKPLVCLCGHIHEGAGVDRIGDCIVANPGPVRRGSYVLLEVESGVVRKLELKHCA